MVLVKHAKQIPEPNLGKDNQMHIAKVMYAQIAVPMSSHTLTLPMEPVKCAQEELYQANQTNQMDLEPHALATLKLVPDVFNTH
jgi:hypothetical protein